MTLTVCPSIVDSVIKVQSTPRFIIADSTAFAAVWPRPRDGRVSHDRGEICEHLAFVAVRVPGDQPVERLLLARPCRPGAGRTVPRLVAEELGDAEDGGDEIRRLVVDDHDSGAEGRAGGACVLEGQRQVELVGAEKRACSAAEQHRFRRPSPGTLEQITEVRPERHLVQAGPSDVPGDAEEPRSR